LTAANQTHLEYEDLLVKLKILPNSVRKISMKEEQTSKEGNDQPVLKTDYTVTDWLNY
jgi:hypothetical protein